MQKHNNNQQFGSEDNLIVAIPSYNIIFINIYHENWIRPCTLLIILIRSTLNGVFVSAIKYMKNGGAFLVTIFRQISSWIQAGLKLFSVRFDIPFYIFIYTYHITQQNP